jgi:hypothetical protein
MKIGSLAVSPLKALTGPGGQKFQLKNNLIVIYVREGDRGRGRDRERETEAETER